jgi:hypothetical protein
VRNKAIDLIFSDDKLEAVAVQFVEEIVQMEKEFLGVGLLTEQDKLYLKKLVPIYCKFFINYTCLHFTKLTRSDLEDCEDMELVLELNHLILSGYFALVLPKPVYQRLDLASRSLSVYVPDLRRRIGVWVHRSEQSSNIESNRMKVDESYCSTPENRETKIARLEKQVAILRNQQEQSTKLSVANIEIVEGYDIIEPKNPMVRNE